MTPQATSRFLRTTIVLISLLAIPGWAKTLYVEKWGIAANTDCTKSAPCPNIVAALLIAGNNDRVIIGPGIYSERVVVNIPGLKLESTAGRYATVIESDIPTLDTVQLNASRVVFGKKNKGFTVIGALTGPVAAIFVDSPGGAAGPVSRVRIEGNRIGQPRSSALPADGGFHNQYGIVVNAGGERIQIRNNIFQNNALTAIECRGCVKGLIRDNRIESNGGSGIELLEASDGISIEGNVVSTNDSNGIVSPIGTVDIRIRNNVSERNRSGDGFTIVNASGARVEANIAARNDDKGFDFFQTADSDPLLFRNNLLVANDNDGMFGNNIEDARIESNTTVDNGDDGIDFSLTDSLTTLKGNNSYGNGGCGLEGDSGDEYTASKAFLRENAAGGTCNASFELTGSTPSKPGPLKANRAKSLLGG